MLGNALNWGLHNADIILFLPQVGRRCRVQEPGTRRGQVREKVGSPVHRASVPVYSLDLLIMRCFNVLHRFINDTIRNDFHQRFLKKYVR